MSHNDVENIKHIFRQGVFTSYLIEAALESRETVFKCTNDPMMCFFDKNCNKFTSHMAAIDILYNYLVLPKELIFKKLYKIPSEKEKIDSINNALKNIAKITYPKQNIDINNDILTRLRNALAHGRIKLKNGKFVFSDGCEKRKNKIVFSIKAQKLIPIVKELEQKIIIPFINGEIEYTNN